MSQRMILKDKFSRVVGYVETEGNGDKVLKDEASRIMGYYSASQNTTRDFFGNVIGCGDLLAVFLRDKIKF